LKAPPDNDASSEEIRLLARIGAGDREAFGALYAHYGAPLFSLAVRMVGNTSDAEEMLQDTFVKIWRNAAAYDANLSRPFTWAVTIMRRTCIDQLRRRRRVPAVTPFLADDDATPDGSATARVREAAEAREDFARVRDALAEIAPERRRAIEYALYSDLTHDEIAHALGQPLGTVKSWIRRGLLDLRANLTDSAP